MIEGAITFQKRGGVSILRIVGPVDTREKFNELATEFSELCGRIAAESDVWVVILDGSKNHRLAMGEPLRNVLILRNLGIAFGPGRFSIYRLVPHMVYFSRRNLLPSGSKRLCHSSYAVARHYRSSLEKCCPRKIQ